MKKALITGITGQMGSYLTELLLAKGYTVYGIIRRSSTFGDERLRHLYPSELEPLGPGAGLYALYGDLSDGTRLAELIYDIKPDEIYNLGAQSDVRVSYDEPIYTSDIVALGAARVLEAIRKGGLRCKYYQASSSECFGSSPPPQNEETPFKPISPYAVSKCFAFNMTVNYRKAYNMFAANGILFNTESPRRFAAGVTRKITKAIANIKKGTQSVLYLGNLDSKRDWSFAGDMVEAIWLIMQHERPDDFCVGSGESHSVKEFLDEAFGYAGLDWHQYVKQHQRYFRPLDPEDLRADCSKAKRVLGWEPKVTFKELVRMMVNADLEE